MTMLFWILLLMHSKGRRMSALLFPNRKNGALRSHSTSRRSLMWQDSQISNYPWKQHCSKRLKFSYGGSEGWKNATFPQGTVKHCISFSGNELLPILKWRKGDKYFTISLPNLTLFLLVTSALIAKWFLTLGYDDQHNSSFKIHRLFKTSY